MHDLSRLSFINVTMPSVALADYFADVHSSDVFDYGFGSVSDFLKAKPIVPYDWVITNPPFRHYQAGERAGPVCGCSMGTVLDAVREEVERTIHALDQKRFDPDPIAGPHFSKITSVMSSA
jgi:hypothetical protein